MAPPDIRSGQHISQGDTRMLPVDAGDRIATHRSLADFETPDGALQEKWREPVSKVLRFFNALPPTEVVPFSPHWQPHQNSSGRYHSEYKLEREARVNVYVYTLDAQNNTSTHRHPEGVIETLIRVGGLGHQVVNGEKRPLEPVNVIYPGDSHQVSTEEDDSAVLMIAITYNRDRIPDSELHIYDVLPPSAIIFNAEDIASQEPQ